MRRWLRTAIPVFVSVTILHLLLTTSLDLQPAPWWGYALFSLLFPGEVISLLITGGHGGTHAADAVAPAVGIVVNGLTWATTIILVDNLLRRLRWR